MLIFIKKWNLVLLVLILAAGTFSLGLLSRKNYVMETMSVPGYGKRIIIDAGHGAPDGGAEGQSGVLEKDLNLAIARYLQGYLEQGGADIVLTRSDDDGIYDSNSKTIRQKKRSDLKNREILMQKSSSELFVSIHMNKFSDGKYSGPQVFYSPNHPSSKALADAVQKEMNRCLNPPASRTIKQGGKDIYLLSKAEIPAILIECGFLSNQREEQLLLDEQYQKQVAWSIYCGLLTYLAET